MHPSINISGIDLFCGVGGLTKGLQQAGVKIELGVDLDPNCQFAYEHNCKSKFVLSKVECIPSQELINSYSQNSVKLLAGCAPCQPFSLYHQKAGASDSRWGLLRYFQNHIEQIAPDLVTMENVPKLGEQRIFKNFLRSLEKQGYYTSFQIVECSEYGVPQTRKRLVLLASKFGPIELIRGRQRCRSVRDVIGKLPSIKAGQANPKDPLHIASSLSEVNLRRIKASKPGGTWRDWPESLRAKCHQKISGKTYPSVYGRMEWDKPAPTLTTQFYGFGNGRFGHPEQNRAISLREGAILQTFPGNYKFLPPGKQVEKNPLGRLIGNAVPVRLAKAIGQSLIEHCQEYAK